MSAFRLEIKTGMKWEVNAGHLEVGDGVIKLYNNSTERILVAAIPTDDLVYVAKSDLIKDLI